jgi:ParB/RepB/Spo0J family partition protein
MTHLKRAQHYDYEVVGNTYLIPLSDIYVDPEFNCRGNFTPQEVYQLGQSINQEGQYIPVIIQPISDMSIDQRPTTDQWKFRLIAGHRRYMAIEYWTSKKEILCHIIYGLNYQQARALNFTENLQRQDLNMLEEAHAIVRMYDKENPKTIAKWIGQSTRWVQARLALLQLPEFIQKKAASGRLSQYDIEILAHVLPDQIELVYQKLITKQGKKEFKSIIRRKSGHNRRARGRKEIEKMIAFVYTYFKFCNLNNDSKNFVTSALAWAAKGISSREFIERRLGFPEKCVIIDEDDKVKGLDDT